MEFVRAALHRGPTLAGLLLASALAAPAFAADVTDARLANADSEPQNWLGQLQNYSGHRYSRLNEITPANVGGLHVAFTLPISTALAGRAATTLDGSPLVDDGMMYFDDGGGVFYKVDVSAGNRASIVWTADATVAKDVPAGSRGIAMIDNLVVHGLRDGRVVAVDRDSGEVVWDQKVAKVDHPGGAGINIDTESFTGGTGALGGYVFVSNSSGDSGARGWLQAINPADGSEVWRTYAIPGPGEPGHETWKDDHNAWKTGGAGMWTQGTYDPETKLVFWGTANPVPMFDPEFRPGDNLFTNSVIAFERDSGKMKWYFQYTPGDSWDYDENGVHMLYDVGLGGESRKVVGHFSRSGFYYQLDRLTGAFIDANQYVDKVNWTAGIDPKTGKPVEYDPALDQQTYIPATRWFRGESGQEAACPILTGGTRWQFPAYNPDTNVSYTAANDGCFLVDVVATVATSNEGGFEKEGGGTFGFDGDWVKTKKEWYGTFTAVNVTNGQRVAQYVHQTPYYGGVVATSGGVVFTTNINGDVVAHDAATLQPLWSFATGIPNRGSPISYSVNGKQYIAVLVAAPSQAFFNPELAWMIPGAMLYVFTL